MEQTSDLHMHSSRPGFLAEVTLALLLVRDRSASGRLSLRNAEKFGVAHLYFDEARLIHVTGDKRDAEGVLSELLNWTKGSVRFDSGMLVTFKSVTWQQASIFGRWLAFLEMRGIMQGIAQERLEGLARSLMLHLPGEPIALPDEVEHHEEYEAEARARQWQRINEGVRQRAQRAEELLNQTFNPERRQHLIQSMQESVESVKQSVSQKVEQVFAQGASPLPPELQARSIRYRSMFRSNTGQLSEGQ